jgi:hypothetical protein
VTWTKSSDDYPDRLLDLSDAAYRLHHAATVFCNRLSLDGSLPRSRLSLIPVPTRTRRAAVVRELIDAGHWIETDDGWTLADFFEAQLSAEEVAAQRRYDAVRQAKRFASTPEKKAELRADEDAAKRLLYAARERRRAISHRESQRDSQRPVPSRPAPSLDESEDDRRAVAGNPDGPRPSPGDAKAALARYGYAAAPSR